MTDKVRSLTIEETIGQLFVIGLPGPDIDSETQDILEEISPGGICLFARNIRNADQTRDLTNRLRSILEVLPVIAIDQEGGLVDRLRRVLSPMPAAEKIRTLGDASLLSRLVSQALLALGINMDFAPVVDVVDEQRMGFSNGLASRAFGRSKEEAADMAAEFLSVLQANGVLGCVKHFPGLGASQVDSHEELPSVDISEDELRLTDLHPYRRLISSGIVHAVMVAHAAFPPVSLQEYDQNGKLLPSSLSYNFVTNLLRGDLGFNGLVVTDDLEMGAIVNNYGIGDACVRAIAAGVDMLAICSDPGAIREGYRSLLRAVNAGLIDLDRIHLSLERVAKLKGRLSNPLPFDRSGLESLAAEITEFTERLNRS